MKFYCFLLLFMTGCSVSIEETSRKKTSNNQVQVEVLFTDDEGYTVKRFNDKGHWRYYVTPRGKTNGNFTRSSNKNSVTIPNEIETINE